MTALLESPNRRRVVGLVLAFSALLFALYAIWISIIVTKSPTLTANSSLSIGPLQGKQLPAFSLPALAGSPTVSSQSLRGKAHIINFYGSWCPPCRAETPTLAQFSSAHLTGPIAFLGVDEHESAAAGSAFDLKSGIRYTVLTDPNANLIATFELVGVPDTLFVSASGKVIVEVQGPLTEAILRTDYGKLMKTVSAK